MIDVTDGSNVDVRLGALKGSGVAPGRVDELCLAPGAESRLDGVGGLLAQSARGAEESPSERHDAEQTPAREWETEERDGMAVTSGCFDSRWTTALWEILRT